MSSKRHCSVCDSSTDCVEHKQRAEDAFSAHVKENTVYKLDNMLKKRSATCRAIYNELLCHRGLSSCADVAQAIVEHQLTTYYY